MKKNLPAISVLIPMYNSAKYIVECLDSVLAQTFDDYEVIVVDDCSTDNSVSIVESYASKFGGKLRLIRSRKNSGNPGTPRNTALRISRGEYIMFVDSDDAITPTALEELYKVAERFKAEIVYCEKFYTFKKITASVYNVDLDKPFYSDERAVRYNLVDNPTPMVSDIHMRIDDLIERRIWIPPWNQLILRKFLIENNILVPEINVTVDVPFNFFLILLAKNIVCVPNVIYFWRIRDDSTCHTKGSSEELMHKRGNACFHGIKIIDDFIRSHELPLDALTIHKIFYGFFKHVLYNIVPVYNQTPATELDKFVRRELEEVKDKTALTAFFFARMNNFNLQVNQRNSIIYQMNAHIQKQNQVLQQQQATIQKQTMQIKQLQNIN